MQCSDVFHHWVAVQFVWYMLTLWYGHFQLLLQEKWQKLCCELHHTSPTHTALSTVGLSYQCVLRSCISACAHFCVCVCVSAGFVHMLLYESHWDKPVKHYSVNTTTLSQSERESGREKSSSCLLMNLANAANVVYQVHIYLFIMAEVKNTTSCPHCSHDSPQGVRKDELVEQKAKEQRGREDKSETENKQTGKHGKQWERRQMKWKDCT